ncbi:D123-domain-containing protein, partial [Blyttiomyces helicus]
TAQQILNCSFSSWYPKFASATLKSKVIRPLPEEFVAYLNADGVFLPLDRYGRSYLWADGDGEDESGEDEDSSIPHFPELQTQIDDAIEELGGAVFPKLNWSSPKDASWIAVEGTLKCRTAADIFLLLKSSDFIAHDLSHAFEDCIAPVESQAALPARPEAFELVLRKWYALVPSMEFRCFVRDGEMVG